MPTIFTASLARLLVAFSALTLTFCAAVRCPAQSVPTSPPAPAAFAPSWAALKAAYDKDTAPADVKEETQADTGFTKTHITFTDAKEDKVIGLMLRPRTGGGPFPVALLLHGLGSDKETMVRFFAPALVRRGILVLALDADRHGERKRAPGTKTPRAEALAEVNRATVPEYRQALSYLKTRKDVDPRRIGLLGYSMGAMMGAILAGVDDRIGSVVLCVGGDPIRLLMPAPQRDRAETVFASNYVGHISPRPVLMINGTQDRVMSETAARLVHNAAREPKTIIWAESGHIIPPHAVKKGTEWLADRLTRK